MTYHAPPELSPASIDLYLDSADISAVRLLSAQFGELTRFSFLKPPTKFPEGITLAETYWFPGKGRAAEVVADISELLLAGGLYRRKNSEWAELHVKHTGTVIRTVTTNLNIGFILNSEARERASYQVRRIETDFEKRMASGDIRAVVNRNYREARQAGKIRLPHHAHVRSLKERAIRESAAYWGRGALFGGDARVEARFAEEASEILAQVPE